MLEGVVEELFEGAGVAGGGLVVVADGLFGEEAGEHGTDLGNLQGDAFLVGGNQQGVGDLSAHRIEGGIGLCLEEFVEGGDSGGHGEGVAAEGSGLVNRTEGGEVIHDFRFAAEGADREAAADDFTEGGEVGGDADAFLYPARGETESRHDLVKDQDGGVLGTEFADSFEEARLGEDEAAVGGVGFEDEARDLVALFGEAGFEGFEVVVFQHEGLGGKTGGDAGAVGVAEGKGTRTRLDEEGIHVTVVTAREFNDFIAPRESPGEADCGKGGFGSAVAHADFFNGGDHRDESFCHLDLVGVGGAEAGAPVEGGGKGGADVGVVMTVDGGAPGADVVDERAAVAGVELGALGAGGKEGAAAD